ncbi:hypothetical protein [Kordia sp.]|uniref:hypothetical protein n=1 Tax=Kordia sp. TaxID=1965332 RepID=UPI003D2C8A69
MYPELLDYIFNYCSKYYSETEQKAKDHYFGTLKFGNYPGNKSPKIDELKKRFLATDTNALKLLENGYPEFIRTTATRIYHEHMHELDLNVCQKCKKITRTPKAKQCRFCFHDWH